MLCAPRPLVFAGLLASTLLAGCGIGTPAVSTGLSTEAASVTGTVYGGSQPVVGATVALYAPATGGYGNAPALITSTTSIAGGSFTLPRPYTCPANSGDVYLLASGGNSGANGANSYIALAALLGPCNNLSGTTTVKINEATTVAAAFALAPFATLSATATGIGTSATNLTGLNNAFYTASHLVSTATGAANPATSLSGMVLPTAEVNTLANILGYCVNSNGTTCAALFNAAKPSDGTAPKDTFQAALDIALNPANGISALFPLGSSYAPFQPALATQPADFALAIQYNGSSIANCGYTTGVAIDQSGDAWVGCGNSTGTGGIAEISPAGVFLNGSTGFSLGAGSAPNGGSGIAIDPNGAAWVTSAGENAVYRISSSGGAARFSLPSALNGPTGIGISSANSEVYIANTGNNPALNNGSPDYLGNSAAILNLSGGVLGNFQPTLAYGPTDIALSSGSQVAINFTGYCTGCNAVPQLAIYPGNSGTPVIYPGYNGGQYGSLAFDAASNLWYLSQGTIYDFTAGAGFYNPGPISITPAFTPISLLFDGNDRLLVAGTDASTYGQIAFYDDNGNALYSITANKTIPPVPFDPTGLDIDASGNIWITGTSSGGSAYLTEIVGAAGPLPTPRTAAASLNQVGARP